MHMGSYQYPKTKKLITADKEFEADPEFCTFWRHLFHTSLEAIFPAMHPAMTKPQSFKDGAQMDDILPFTASFPHANIHELIAPDILHQIIKGTFKDHLISWVETYLKEHYKNDFAAVLADIDHQLVLLLCHHSLASDIFHKAMDLNNGQVYLSAIAGYVPNEMLQALSAFMDFCYIVCQSSLGETDLEALAKALQCFETHHSIFEAEGIHSDGISIPQIHALQHYHEVIELFGAPNGLSTSIVESKHIRAVKRPYQ
ncbi:hypothetical protein EDD16DRAFT_1526724 [Pisolithus croceorrhizus]|nr:hypothetical protein EDD16DRAFT_1526724 [Pisolithus croceorrhizus]KAI6166506.1 hypothetical protein EDD17DRAFT_1504928 [Pisolithus thermaeus]